MAGPSLRSGDYQFCFRGAPSSIHPTPGRASASRIFWKSDRPQGGMKMFDLLRRFLFSALALGCAAAWAAQSHVAKISAAPGTLVRWSAPGTTRCTMKGRSWAAVKDTCYYPVDLQQNPGILPIARSGSGHSAFARIVVEAFDYGTEEITLPDIPQANP